MRPRAFRAWRMLPRWAALSFTLLAVSAPRALALEETPADPAISTAAPRSGTGIELSGTVDTYYGYNFNRPLGDTRLRNFDTRHDQLSMALIELALEQKPTEESRLGFRGDLDFGPVTDLVHAFEPGGAEVYRNFEQAYLSYLVPVGRGLQVDAGKFVTPHGAEVIESKDNWNYSRSLLFALAIPYYHTGLRATYPFGDRLTMAGFLVNGWNNSVENNGGFSFGVQAVLKPTDRLTIVQNVMLGPEQRDNTDDDRFLSDTTVTLTVTPSLSLMANYDHGVDRVEGADVTWKGVAAYARLQVNSWWAVAPRLEWLDDEDGFMTGTSQTLRELTLTSEQKLGGALLTRLEVRRDLSDQPSFDKQGAPVKAQTTFTVGLVFSFNKGL
jgi:hypothetical protein